MDTPWLKILVRAVAFPIATVLTISTIRSFSPGLGLLLCVPFGLLALAIWTIAKICAVVMAVWRLSWSKGALALAGLAIFWISALPIFLWSGDYVHLAAMYPFYASKISRASESPSGEVSFDWGADGFASTATTDYVLIYSARAKLKTGNRTETFPDNAAQYWVDTRHLIGGFYLRETTYP